MYKTYLLFYLTRVILYYIILKRRENDMKINESIRNELLTDDGHMGTVHFDPKYTALPRKEGTIQMLKSMNVKNIIHIGCCGHLCNIKKQMESHSHFHSMLIRSFDKVIGFDINKEAVDYLLSFHITDVYAMDFVQEHETVSEIIGRVFGTEPYAILLPEVLEHIGNPVSFLSETVQYYGDPSNRLVISVPNAYGFGRVCDALFHNKEFINMDHKYMFTPATLLKVMCTAGIVPDELQFLDLYKYSKVFKKPMLGNTILASGYFQA